jgi:hypothetical protein
MDDKIMFRKFPRYRRMLHGQRLQDIVVRRELVAHVWYPYINGRRIREFAIKRYLGSDLIVGERDEYLVLKNGGFMYYYARKDGTPGRDCSVFPTLIMAKHVLLDHLYMEGIDKKIQYVVPSYNGNEHS